MTRQKNPRRVVLFVMRAMVKNTQTMVSTWNVAGTMRGVERQENGSHSRKRRPDEYPENRIEDWERLAEFMAVVERQAQQVGDYAREMALRMKEQEQK